MTNSIESDCCGKKAYDPERFLCCGGTLVPSAGGKTYCCGKQGYNPTTQVCCNGVIGQGDYCCGDKPYKAQITSSDGEDMWVSCCDPSTGAVTDSVNQNCCGRVPYNRDEQYCSYDVLASGSGTDACPTARGLIAYDPEKKRCCNGVLGDGDNCCGSKAYWSEAVGPDGDRVDIYCCDATKGITTDPVNSRCCGYISYDPTKQACCNEILAAGEGNYCCESPTGVTAYFYETQRCCRGVVGTGSNCCGNKTVPDTLKGPDGKPYTPYCCNQKTGAMTDSVKSNCCGGVPYNQDTQACCNGILAPGAGQSCCPTATGVKAYDYYKQACCLGVLGAIGEDNCCGAKPYPDTITGANGKPIQVQCCNPTTGAVTNRNKTQCCGGVAYDPKTQACCSGGVLPTKGTGSECCATLNGLWAYDPAKQTCCNGVLANGTNCCGSRGYPSRVVDRAGRSYSPQCCNAATGEITDAVKTDCCGGVAYDPKKQACCDDELASGTGTECCPTAKGLMAYDSKSWSCCNGVLAEGTKCCGAKPFVDHTHTPDGLIIDVRCCDPEKGVLSDGVRTQCCGRTPYNPDTQACCNDVLAAGRGTQCCESSTGVKAYDYDTQRCCNGVVGEGDSCCGTRAYWQVAVDPVTDAENRYECCDPLTGTVTAADEDNADVTTLCCNYTPYNPAAATCCEGILAPASADSCCGSKGYNSATQACCDGVIGIGDTCCGSVAYNSASQQCCFEGVRGATETCW
ncbi:hypothetical protein HYH03_010031 [Edaphochlamys debaryana]|uniref:Galaxin-like repeats domain-containing protein n=1 Tax=Edaphochlamys debaryana TaxID=47281 RepID=A0A835XXX6_9CHLO|nr:hypothetical protein HYH03_010031 [Edaphochlamys debaryana]|eukprot:KAG2491662.1 hypothetical protein HYH03_010031 [Edaphochlamys debaryana]